jgi:hypothetical protein
LRYQGNFAAGKNKFINADFSNWQRGTSFTLTNAVDTYCADRFMFAAYGTGTAGTATRQTFTPGTAPIAGYEGQYFARLTNFATASAWQFRQRIENVQTFAGQTITFSFWAKASTTISNVSIEGTQNFGSGGSTANGFGIATNQTLTTSWQRFSYTYTIPSIAGKTIGTSSFLELSFYQGSGATNSSTIDTWGWQAELGNTATAFQTATGTIQGELSACQRYYVRWSGGNSYSHFGTGVTQSATNAYFTVVQPVEMRVAPTALDFSTMGFFNYVPNVFALSNLTLNSATTKVSQLYGTTSGATAQQFVTLCTNNSTAGFIGLSAEL